MGVRIVVFREHGSPIESGALLWDSTSGYPLALENFSTGDNAGDFLDWMDERTNGTDLRSIPAKDLQSAQAQWFKDHPKE